jgi:hypothetical protein
MYLKVWDYFTSRISVVRPETNIVLCEVSDFVYAWFQVRE